jgi:prevent-host-death family protein
MDQVGVRDLRQNASKFLDRVKAGEVIEVTERGAPVAHLVPVPDSEREMLIGAGLLSAALTSANELSVPTKRLPRGVTTEATLEELRADRV